MKKIIDLRLKKFFASFLSFLLVFNPLVVPLAWAEGDSTIITGDAESLAEVETTANTNLDCVPGEISTPEGSCASLEAETDCPDGVVISNDNLADVVDEADSVATTGDNLIEGAVGDALIDTGNATAGASLENKINTNIVDFREAEEVEEDVETEEADGEPIEIAIENENEATLVNEVDVLAETGENEANGNDGETVVETGEALAYANLVNLLNTNIVGSDFELYLLNLLEGQEGDIDLNEIWQEIVESEEFQSISLTGEETPDSLLVQNENQACLENEVEITATTGLNEANKNDGQVGVETGDATALANIINFVNVNLAGSEFFLGIINIFGSFTGDLILPRPDRFVNSSTDPILLSSSSSSDVFENQNSAEIQNEVTTVADSGVNETDNNQGDSLIETGNASSQANAFSLVNTNIWLNDWFFVAVSHLGSWLGEIFGWSTPDAQEESGEENTTVFQLNSEAGAETGGQSQSIGLGNGLPQNIIQNQNQASVTNKIGVSALSGQNQANENGSDVEIKTGNTLALANLFNFINLNIFGSRWFIGLVNILGDWSGNIIFAYPDVAVNLTNGSGQVVAGETTSYTLSYQNQGYDLANDVWIDFELPEGFNFLGDSSGITPEVSGQSYSWFLGALAVNEVGSFTINVEVDPNFSFEESLSFWSKIIPQAHAAEAMKEKRVVANVSIGTADPESDFSNNTYSAATIVYQTLSSQSEAEQDSEINQGQPVLEVSAWNNVGEFVYLGDTVTFEITVRNTGETISESTYLLQELFNSLPEEEFGVVEIEIGRLEPGKAARVTFGMQLNDDGFLFPGDYHTFTQAFGRAPNGNEVASNQAETGFEIRGFGLINAPEAQAALKEEDVLGVVVCPECQENVLPYFLLFLLSSFWLIDRGKKVFKVKEA